MKLTGKYARHPNGCIGRGARRRSSPRAVRVVRSRPSRNKWWRTPAYTRGSDLSGTLEGAGGIGGLLARSDGYASGRFTNHLYYHADGNGNITYLVKSNQTLAVSYQYDPYGNLVAYSGVFAMTNTYRFSSKEFMLNSGLYYYGYRFYVPNLQRWLNRDPIMENGGINLYGFVGNDSESRADVLGLGPVGLPGWGIPGKGNPQSNAQKNCSCRGGHYGSTASNKYGGDISACVRACVANSPGIGLITWPAGGGIGGGMGVLYPIGGGIVGGVIGAGGPYAICLRSCSEPGCSLDQSTF